MSRDSARVCRPVVESILPLMVWARTVPNILFGVLTLFAMIQPQCLSRFIKIMCPASLLYAHAWNKARACAARRHRCRDIKVVDGGRQKVIPCDFKGDQGEHANR